MLDFEGFHSIGFCGVSSSRKGSSLVGISSQQWGTGLPNEMQILSALETILPAIHSFHNPFSGTLVEEKRRPCWLLLNGRANHSHIEVGGTPFYRYESRSSGTVVGINLNQLPPTFLFVSESSKRQKMRHIRAWFMMQWSESLHLSSV